MKINSFNRLARDRKQKLNKFDIKSFFNPFVTSVVVKKNKITSTSLNSKIRIKIS